MQVIFGNTLPWPLSYVIPYTQAMSVGKKYKGCNASEVRFRRNRLHAIFQNLRFPERHPLISPVARISHKVAVPSGRNISSPKYTLFSNIIIEVSA
jgi:hypothetical protein